MIPIPAMPLGDVVAHAMPLLFLAVVAMLLLVASCFWRPAGGGAERGADVSVIGAVLGCLIAGGLAWVRFRGQEVPQTAMLFAFDRIGWLGGLFLLAATIPTLLLAGPYLRERRLPLPEFVALVLFGVVGMWTMILTTHLVMIFLGLETLSLAAYVLAGYHRAARPSIEAGVKYFLLGAIAAGFLLFGLAFLYGGTGSFDLRTIAQTVFAEITGFHRLYTLIGIALICVGLAFKIGAVPFQFWTPDVYTGAPLPVTIFFATAVKIGAFCVFWRVGEAVTPMLGGVWQQAMWGLAVATMLLGNLAALAQDDLKRMLAYSSIAHAGYALIALVIGHGASLFFYLAAYAIMTIGAFATLMALGSEGRERTTLADVAGLGTTHPRHAFVLALFLFSLAGIPPTVGFFAKYYLFQAAIGGEQVTLVVIAVINSVVSVAYYVRPVVVMYFRPVPEQGVRPLALTGGMRFVIGLSLAGVVGLGLFPSRLLALIAQIWR
ncbi:MAG: NADH-quinone oxidoreductase subunit N [Deltaproteobacteria bacterium]|nr:NADH-quinone oxidoreductase subunit N [Deltaproteobacteria bacterium]